MPEGIPEPWLRGPIQGVEPLVAPVLHAFQQAREDLARFTEGLSEEQIWARPHGLTPLGFHLRHIAGSVDRLLTYLRGEALTERQVGLLGSESKPGSGRGALLAEIETSLAAAEGYLRRLDPELLGEPRVVGRKRLPTTVAGLVVHLAEHTQRHVGQAISAAQLARRMP